MAPLILGGLLFWLGILSQLFLSGAIAWAEIEARVYTPQPDYPALDLKCPLMLARTNRAPSRPP